MSIGESIDPIEHIVDRGMREAPPGTLKHSLSQTNLPYQLLMRGNVALLYAGQSHLFTHEEARAVIEALQAFYDAASEKDIKAWNWRLKEDWARMGVRKVSKPQSGHVYLLRRNELYKIGLTVGSVEQRARQIEREQLPTGHQGSIEIVHVIQSNNIQELEQFLHNLFSNKHSHNEWFALTDEDVVYIRALGDKA
jgi:hypothetical protein